MAERVCLLRHGYHPGDPRIERLLAALQSRGLDVDLICLQREGERPFEVVAGVEVHRLPVEHRREGIFRYLYEYAAFAILAATRLTRLDTRRRYSLVEVHTMPDFLVFAALVPKLRGARVLLDMHEVMPELFETKFGGVAGRLIGRFVRLTEHAAMAFADAVLTVSDPTYDVLVARGAPKAKLTIVMNTPDADVFHPRAPKSIDREKPVILAHGTLLARSGFDTLIAAFAMLRERVPGATLRILGAGEHASALLDAAAEAGIADAVEFAGYVPLSRIASDIAAADVGVAPNEVDEFTNLIVPTRLLEFVGMGVPAITVRSAAVERYFDETCVGLYRSGDVGDLADVLQRTVFEPQESGARVRRATERLDVISWPRMHERYIAVVDDLLSSASRG